MICDSWATWTIVVAAAALVVVAIIAIVVAYEAGRIEGDERAARRELEERRRR